VAGSGVFAFVLTDSGGTVEIRLHYSRRPLPNLQRTSADELVADELSSLLSLHLAMQAPAKIERTIEASPILIT
jgi:hypothetical protein